MLPAAHLAGVPGGSTWLGDLEFAARTLLDAGSPDVWEQLSRQFEGQLIRTALALTRGRRIEAAQKLGIGRNTITRKIQELGPGGLSPHGRWRSLPPRGRSARPGRAGSVAPWLSSGRERRRRAAC